MNAPVTSRAFEQARPAMFSTAEFLDMIEHDILGDRRVELVSGELIELPPPGTLHALLQAEVAFRLQTFARQIGRYAVVGDVGIDLFEGTLRSFDVGLVDRPLDHKMLKPEQVIVLVEIAVSTVARDLGEKARDYAAAGVQLVWVVDPESKVVHVLTGPQADGYAERTVIRFGEPLAVPGTDQTIVID